MNEFLQFLLAENRDVFDFETSDELCTVLCKFYTTARKKDGTHYKLSALSQSDLNYLDTSKKKLRLTLSKIYVSKR